jgi:hypothetical protein
VTCDRVRGQRSDTPHLLGGFPRRYNQDRGALVDLPTGAHWEYPPMTTATNRGQGI